MRLTRVAAIAIGLGAGAGLSQRAHAHFRLTQPAPRTDANGLTVGPCGAAPRGAEPTLVFEGGSTATIEWEVAQNHGGEFRVALSFGDDEGFDDNVLAERIADGEALYSLDVDIPNEPCEACTLQVIQFTANGNGGYFSCADVDIEATGGGCAVGHPHPRDGIWLAVVLLALRRRRRTRT